MRFCCNVLRNSKVIGIAMTFMKNKFSFKLNLYFMKHMHTNTKNRTYAPIKKSFLTFFKINFF